MADSGEGFMVSAFVPNPKTYILVRVDPRMEYGDEIQQYRPAILQGRTVKFIDLVGDKQELREMAQNILDTLDGI